MKNPVKGIANQASRGLNQNRQQRPTSNKRNLQSDITEPLVHELVVVGTGDNYKPYKGKEPIKRVENVFGGEDPDHPDHFGEKLNKFKENQIKYSERKENNYVFHCVTHTGENLIMRSRQERLDKNVKNKNKYNYKFNKRPAVPPKPTIRNRPKTALSNQSSQRKTKGPNDSLRPTNPSWNNFMNRVKASNARQEGKK